MAGIFSPKNVAKLLIAKSNISGSTLENYISTSTAGDGEVAIISANGEAPSEGTPFQVHLKETDAVDGINSTEIINPDDVLDVKVSEYKAEEAKTVTITVDTAEAGTTYRASIIKYDHIQSSENFRHIHGFYVTKTSSTDTVNDIASGLATSLQNSLKREGLLDKEFSVTVATDTVTISNIPQKVVVGKDQGSAIRFDVESAAKSNANATLSDGGDLGYTTVTVTAGGHPGANTGKQVLNLEYFLNGYETTDYSREVGFPNNFNVDYKANTGATYNSVIILHKKDRTYTNIERQPRELYVVFEKPTDDLAGNAETNNFLGQLRNVLGTSKVPADLAVV